MAAVLAEQNIVAPLQIPAGLPIAPEILVPRMGDTMLEKGILSTEELHRALDYQKAKMTAGQPLLLGQALLELGLINRETLDSVITMQILRLQTALSDANHQLEQRVQERTIDLQHALDRLAELNQLKSNFIANISHELRTPLTHLKGYLDILAEEGLGSLNAQQAEVVSVLQRAENRLESLIEDLIQFSLASRGELSLNLETTELGKLALIAVDRSKHKARNNAITLKANVTEDLTRVRADEDKIGWVLFHLLDNALKFTQRGGWVMLDVKNEAGLITVVVSDNGIGIPAERLTEIFEPFHQLDGSTTRRYAGTGLGLSMAQRILEAHGSQIKVASVLGEGSRFAFSLPLADQLAPEEMKE